MSIEKIVVSADNEQLLLKKEGVKWILKKDAGYSPVQMLVAAAASCGGYVLASILNNSKIPFILERIEVTYDRDETRRASPVAKIELTFYVKAAADLQERIKRCLKMVAPNCPVIQSLAPNIKIAESIVFVD
ncbi:MULTISPECIES: OsmC family protein [unclassified Enterococcus]|uniref:OsmC family protein n=1 Tax=unclassified Enterococcus TaxID=2608891 RepID=UPI0015556551|nr:MULTISPECIES: OsmC family protein [unclassified Enterococcus]MBS7578071.1 OsmC family protein [Enterococcus sp. MMGLQ5-2]MBS7585331.1 OsmC family protein [Enterococcus sp. MMGLQ5-1]NPD13188.1 OsmC family protein [Enterococcus sp. MMGLQ5-1]NPD37902.1 OsmC family protein [Enterococcus sp. MMGLQ5-2]